MSGEKVSADETERALIEARIQAERINEANHTDPTAEMETSPFVHLIAEMKYEICSFLSDSEKFELLKSTSREKLELLKSTDFPRTDKYIYFLHKYLYSGIRSDDDIRAAVDAWCRDPVVAEIKYGHISGWDTSLVTNMSKLFDNTRNFNDDISQWTVSNVTNMYCMFYNAPAFNQPLEQWNVGNVTNMRSMFRGSGMSSGSKPPRFRKR
jgi:surface protein